MTKKQELIEKLAVHKDYFSLINIEDGKLEFLEEHLLQDKLYFIETLIRNRERLKNENINI